MHKLRKTLGIKRNGIRMKLLERILGKKKCNFKQSSITDKWGIIVSMKDGFDYYTFNSAEHEHLRRILGFRENHMICIPEDQYEMWKEGNNGVVFDLEFDDKTLSPKEQWKQIKRHI